MQVADLKMMNQLKDMSLKSEREQKENYKHQALKQTTKCNKLAAGLGEVEEKLKNVQKGLRP